MASNPTAYDWSNPSNSIINSGSTGYGGMRQISPEEQAQRDSVDGEYYSVQHPMASMARNYEEQKAISDTMNSNPGMDESLAQRTVQQGYVDNRINRTVNNLQSDLQGALSQSPQEQETPADQAESKSQELQGALQNAQQEQADLAAKGYNPVPDASTDPVGHLASINSNQAKGVGGFSGVADVKIPTPPTQKQVTDMNLNQQGKQAAFDQNKIPAWYKSESFSMGLISFGLNLLSGNDLAKSFGAAGEAFNQMYGAERRSYWVEDLAKQGYDPVEIEQWQRTGDSKVLTSPQEKQMKAIQQQMAVQNLDNAMYEGSPEMRSYNLNREQRKDSLQEAQVRNSMANSNASLGLQRERLNFEIKKEQDKQLAAMQDPEFGVDTKTGRLIQTQVMPYMRASQVKASYFDQGKSNFRDALKAYDSGDISMATQIAHGGQEAMTKGYKGGTGGITPQEIEYHTGNPNILERTYEKLNKGITGSVSRDELVRLYTLADKNSIAEHNTMRDYLTSHYDSLASSIGPQRAQRTLNLIGSGAGMGQVIGEPANPNTVKITRTK